MWEKTIWEPLNVTKVQSHVILVLHNMKIIPSNVREKISEPPNMRKVHSHAMLVLYNVRMVPSNMRKNKETAKYDKSTVTCDVGTTQCDANLNRHALRPNKNIGILAHES